MIKQLIIFSISVIICKCVERRQSNSCVLDFAVSLTFISLHINGDAENCLIPPFVVHNRKINAKKFSYYFRCARNSTQHIHRDISIVQRKCTAIRMVYRHICAYMCYGRYIEQISNWHINNLPSIECPSNSRRKQLCAWRQPPVKCVTVTVRRCLFCHYS